jgi:hypothetical protein
MENQWDGCVCEKVGTVVIAESNEKFPSLSTSGLILREQFWPSLALAGWVEESLQIADQSVHPETPSHRPSGTLFPRGGPSVSRENVILGRRQYLAVSVKDWLARSGDLEREHPQKTHERNGSIVLLVHLFHKSLSFWVLAAIMAE